jgi:hypothetical protein
MSFINKEAREELMHGNLTNPSTDVVSPFTQRLETDTLAEDIIIIDERKVECEANSEVWASQRSTKASQT